MSTQPSVTFDGDKVLFADARLTSVHPRKLAEMSREQILTMLSRFGWHPVGDPKAKVVEFEIREATEDEVVG